MWVLDRMDPGLASHNVAGLVALTGSLDVGAPRAALAAAVARHEVLRTTLRECDGEPAQGRGGCGVARLARDRSIHSGRSRRRT